SIANLKMPFAASNEPEMSDAPVGADIIWGLRDAVAAEVRLAGAHDAAHAADRNGHQRGIAQMGDADGYIDAFVDKIDDAIDEEHVGADLRVALQEFADDRTQIAPPEGHRGGHRKLADRLGSARAENVLGLLRGGEDVAAAREILRALVSQVDAPGRAL